jgi:hypothetical protein
VGSQEQELTLTNYEELNCKHQAKPQFAAESEESCGIIILFMPDDSLLDVSPSPITQSTDSSSRALSKGINRLSKALERVS